MTRAADHFKPRESLMYRCLGLALFLPVLCGGCAAADLAGGDKVLKFHADDEPVLEQVRHGGDYVVVYRERATGELWQAHDSRRTLKKGDDIGFTRDEAGKLVAIAAGQERTLGRIPVTAQYAAWYRLPDDFDAKRRFNKDVGRIAETVTKAAVVGATVAGVAALTPDGSGDDDDDENPDEPPTQRRHRHGR